MFGGTVSQGFTPAVLVKKVEPDYPAQAQKQKIGLPVKVDATVGENGNVRAVRVVSGPAELADAAASATRPLDTSAKSHVVAARIGGRYSNGKAGQYRRNPEERTCPTD